jgi:lysyl-tRNA synthetase class II
MCEEAVGWRMKMAEQNNQQKKGGQQQDANQLIQVRYDKLHELQANGKNPFEITKYDVTHHSTELRESGRSGSDCCRTYDVQTCYGKSFFL